MKIIKYISVFALIFTIGFSALLGADAATEFVDDNTGSFFEVPDDWKSISVSESEPTDGMVSYTRRFFTNGQYVLYFGSNDLFRRKTYAERKEYQTAQFAADLDLANMKIDAERPFSQSDLMSVYAMGTPEYVNIEGMGWLEFFQYNGYIYISVHNGVVYQFKFVSSVDDETVREVLSSAYFYNDPGVSKTVDTSPKTTNYSNTNNSSKSSKKSNSSFSSFLVRLIPVLFIMVFGYIIRKISVYSKKKYVTSGDGAIITSVNEVDMKQIEEHGSYEEDTDEQEEDK